MKNVFLFATLVLLFAHNAGAQKKGRKPSKKKVAPKTVVAPAPAPVSETNPSNTMRLCDATLPQPAWFLELPKGFAFPANFPKPSAYRLVSTIDSTFMAFLNGISTEGNSSRITIPLFMNNTLVCKDFIINRTQTLDSALQAKYPFLMSFKAYAADNGLNAARIERDETAVRMMVTYDGKTYFVQSLPWNKRMLFACYAKDDPNFIKDKFER